MGDAAIGMIASLGMPPETRLAVVALLRQKIANGGLRQGLLFTIQETASSETLDLILQNIGDPGTESAKPLSSPFSLLVNSLTKAAASVPEDADLQKRVWDTIREHRLEATRSGDVAGRCNTETTVVDYAHWVADDSEAGDPTTRRYIYYDRMSELTRPQALSGWDVVERDALLPILKADATQDTKLTGQYVTTNVRLKEAAFETAFCIGTNDLLTAVQNCGAVPPLSDALSPETCQTRVSINFDSPDFRAPLRVLVAASSRRSHATRVPSSSLQTAELRVPLCRRQYKVKVSMAVWPRR